MIEEEHVATSGQRPSDRQIAVTNALGPIELAPHATGIVQIPLAMKRGVGRDYVLFDQGQCGQRLENRAGRNRHPQRAIKERPARIVEHRCDARVAAGEPIGIEARRGGRGQQFPRMHVHDQNRTAGRRMVDLIRRPGRTQCPVQQLFGMRLQGRIDRQDHVGPGLRIPLDLGGQDLPTPVDGQAFAAGSAAQLFFERLLEPEQPDGRADGLVGVGRHEFGPGATVATDVAEQVRGGRSVRIDTPRVGHDFDAWENMGSVGDGLGCRGGQVVGQAMEGGLLRQRDQRRRQRGWWRKQFPQDGQHSGLVGRLVFE